jgi:ribosomal protein RSM22 (predicted rRNA methylase)
MKDPELDPILYGPNKCNTALRVHMERFMQIYDLGRMVIRLEKGNLIRFQLIQFIWIRCIRAEKETQEKGEKEEANQIQVKVIYLVSLP